MSTQLLDTPAKHAFSISALIDNVWTNVADAVFRRTSGSVAKLAEATILNAMRRIRVGELKVCTPEQIYVFPMSEEQDNCRPDLRAEFRVLNDTFWLRLCTAGDLGFAEAYMFGDVACDDLVSLFEIFLENEEALSGLGLSSSFLFNLPRKITNLRFLGTVNNSHANISAHYDISNDMFAGFLSKDMTYSCAIFDSQGGSKSVDAVGGEDNLARDELHEGQVRKLKHAIDKAKILPGHRILDIGCGWGSLAMMIAESIPSTKIDAITLSVHQQSLAQERIAAAGLSDRITVHLMDYRKMPSDWENAFDRVVSIEMMEHVGEDFLEEFWRMVHWAMKLKDAIGVVQVITMPEAIFPGGFIPSLSRLVKTLETGSQGHMTVDSVTNISVHYVRTLREWRKRFLKCFEDVIVPALQRDYPDVMGEKCGDSGKESIDVFKRKWIYYFCYCEIGFMSKTLGGET
ncbi:S-adenosyl-L-methionine-dependent methyltransferase [Amanita rubescens]|nr:S-adenosyl-L-methionine-dependent methyltransferase [Amanita rubescens]